MDKTMDCNEIICVPGQRLCLSNEENISGRGTYERLGYIYSMLAGVVKTVQEENSSVIEVHGLKDQSMVPTPGDIVTAKVTVLNLSWCKCEIKCIGDKVLTRLYRGILRKEDVRATDKDRVEIYKCFRPGDIILARVLPIAEPNTFLLSTAENELGVAIAHTEAGLQMIPINWTEMQCPRTLVKEPRKVAKIVPESITVE